MDRSKLDAWLQEVKKGFGNAGRHRPSPAMVVALIALCISMGTSAYAAIQIPKNSVGTAQLKNNAVTAKKIKNGSVTKAKIGKASVTATALAAGSVSYNSVQQGAIGRTSLIPGAVGSEQIENGSVDDAKIKDQSVGEEKIKPGAVGGEKLKTGAVGPDKIENGAVGEDKLAAASVGTGKLKDGAVGLEKLKDGAVGPDKIVDGSIDTPKINAGAITAAKIAAASVGVNALQALPSARKTVGLGGTQSIAHGTPFPVDVVYPTTVFNTGGLAPGANPERLVATEPGIYDFAANATWAANNVGDREISVWKTTPGFVQVSSRIASQRIPATQGGATPINLTGTAYMNAGEFLTVRAYQDSGAALNLISTDGNIPTFSLTYLSPYS